MGEKIFNSINPIPIFRIVESCIKKVIHHLLIKFSSLVREFFFVLIQHTDGGKKKRFLEKLHILLIQRYFGDQLIRMLLSNFMRIVTDIFKPFNDKFFSFRF